MTGQGTFSTRWGIAIHLKSHFVFYKVFVCSTSGQELPSARWPHSFLHSLEIGGNRSTRDSRISESLCCHLQTCQLQAHGGDHVVQAEVRAGHAHFWLPAATLSSCWGWNWMASWFSQVIDKDLLHLFCIIDKIRWDSSLTDSVRAWCGFWQQIVHPSGYIFNFGVRRGRCLLMCENGVWKCAYSPFFKCFMPSSGDVSY